MSLLLSVVVLLLTTLSLPTQAQASTRTAQASAGFSYRENHVTLTYKNLGSYGVMNTIYTVTDASVTTGQDPQGRLRPGLGSTFVGNQGDFVFSVGRQASKTVADWWKARISAGQTTFNDNPEELNFATRGTLRIGLYGGGVGFLRFYDINNFALAQGHTGSSNNWWAGGNTCTNVGDHKVSCEATAVDGKSNIKVTFQRGGVSQAVDKVEVTDIGNPY